MGSRPRARRTATSAPRTHKIVCRWAACSVASNFDRKTFLRPGLFRLLLPFLNARMFSAQCQQLLLVVNHLLPRPAGERIIAHQKDRLLRADFLAKTAKDAAQHVDLEFQRYL